MKLILNYKENIMNIIKLIRFIVLSIISKVIYIDLDGTLFSDVLDKWFINNDYNVNLYNKLYVNNLDINYKLILCIRLVKIFGVEVNILTNRGYKQAKMTLDNLGKYSKLFNKFIFCQGLKKLYRLKGLLVDNEVKYNKVCDTFMYYKF